MIPQAITSPYHHLHKLFIIFNKIQHHNKKAIFKLDFNQFKIKPRG